ncbi:MAG: amidohydrolase [Deltaproteobacteria bacterium]|jgi:aminobenzoyl-glutamate utilization protein B|nr:amidohydrolase [Deltaproteobacteria bacterium]
MDIAAIKKYISEWVESNTLEFDACSQYMFDNPELGMQEFEASRRLADIAKKHGFNVKMGVAGMPTAFMASYGSGKPVIAFNVEYDCLPGLSQKVSTKKEPVQEGAPGHGCGHCLIGPGALMSGIALRHALETFGLPGTVKLYGSPAEEICIGKPFMARAKLYDDVDAFLDWHPFFNKTYVHRGTNAYFYKYYHFKGKTAHGNSPWNGRSSLDAAMLMGHAVELLREHIVPGTEAAANTINYTFSHVGPEIPSVVPDRTSVWYIGRFNTTEIMLDVMERIDNCAKGAALATGTTVESELVTAVHENIPNKILGQLVHENYLEIGHMPVTAEQQQFAMLMQKEAGNEQVGIVQEALPPSEFDAPVTDASEYSWLAPLATIWMSTLPGPALHHWVVTSACGSDIGKAAIHHSAKLLARSAIDLVASPELLQKAQEEHKKNLKGRTYRSLIPDEITPPLDKNKDTMAKYRRSV